MQQNQFELAVVIPRDGKSTKIREYAYNGLTFVVGKPGQVYAIQFRNNSANRVQATISVDGLSVIDGQPANVNSVGYVVEGYSAAEIKGWRTSTVKSNQFFFEQKSKGYAASQADDSNCGVIACKVFYEKIKTVVSSNPVRIEEHHHHYHENWTPYRYYWPPWYPVIVGVSGQSTNEPVIYATQTTSALGSASLSTCVACSTSGQGATALAAENQIPEFSLGTGWGAEQTDCVSTVDFERGIECASLSLYYADEEALRKIGIDLAKEVAISRLPQGFGGFCKPPLSTNRL